MQRVICFLSLCCSPAIIAHPGSFDAYGCHADASTWHCHVGPLAGSTFATEASMLQAWEALPAPSTDPLVFNRRDYLTHWDEPSGSCFNTKALVFIQEHVVTTPQYGNCTLISGYWYDPYVDRYVSHTSSLEIDHLVSLKEAHVSGAYTWSLQERHAYANDIDDPRVLRALYYETRQDKGDKDPAHWLPPNAAYHCQYIKDWVGVKYRYDLDMDPAEQAAIDAILAPGASGLPTEVGSWRFDKEQPGLVASAIFSAGLERDGSCGYFDTARVATAVTISGSIRPDRAHIGQIVDLYVVDRVNGEFLMRTESGAFVPWNGRVPDLVPAVRAVVLTGLESVDIFRGTLGSPGAHRLFLGYRLDGELYYSPIPVPLTITE